MKEYKGSQCAEFRMMAKVDAGKQAVLVSCKVWGTRANSVAQYINGGDQFSCTGTVGSIRVLDPQGDNTEGLIAINVNINDFAFPKPAGSTAGGRRPESSKPVTPKIAPRPSLPTPDDDEIPF